MEKIPKPQQGNSPERQVQMLTDQEADEATWYDREREIFFAAMADYIHENAGTPVTLLHEMAAEHGMVAVELFEAGVTR